MIHDAIEPKGLIRVIAKLMHLERLDIRDIVTVQSYFFIPQAQPSNPTGSDDDMGVHMFLVRRITARRDFEVAKIIRGTFSHPPGKLDAPDTLEGEIASVFVRTGLPTGPVEPVQRTVEVR